MVAFTPPDIASQLPPVQRAMDPTGTWPAWSKRPATYAPPGAGAIAITAPLPMAVEVVPWPNVRQPLPVQMPPCCTRSDPDIVKSPTTTTPLPLVARAFTTLSSGSLGSDQDVPSWTAQ